MKHITKFAAYLLLGWTCLSEGAVAQTGTPDPDATPGRGRSMPTWTASLPGGTYQVALSAIRAISIHEYVVDGTARVTEVNIDTQGAALVRFYVIEPAVSAPGGVGQSALTMIEDRAKEITSRVTGGDAGTKVAKSYPTTTHARTIEYRLASKESLQKLFDNVQKSWTNRRADTFKP